MEKKFFPEQSENLSLRFLNGSNESPSLFFDEDVIRGYDKETPTSKNDASFPISAYIDFLYCQTFAYLRYVNGVRPSLGPEAIIGTVTHREFQSLMLRECAIACKYRFDDGGLRLREARARRRIQ